MIKSLKITNFRGEELKIELADPWEHGLIIQSIDGIGPVNATINTTEVATTDGSRFNSARLSQRNIVLYFVFKEVIRRGFSASVSYDPREGTTSSSSSEWDEGSESIEDIRHKTYKYFPLKKQLTLEFETDTRTLQISGYVESNTPSIFSEQEGCQVSIVCPDPYFYDANGVTEVEFGTHDPALEFPISSDQEYTAKVAGVDTEYYGTNTFSDATGDLSDRTYPGGTTLRVWSMGKTKDSSGLYDTITYEALDEEGVSVHTDTYELSDRRWQAFKTYNETDRNTNYRARISTLRGIDHIESEVGIIVKEPDKNIVYEGDSDTGFTIVMHAYGNVTNPSIVSKRTNEIMQINTTMQDGDEIVISTVKGHKSATRIRSGITTNILSSLGTNIPWFLLTKGDNWFHVTAVNGIDLLETRIRFNTLYEGV